MKAFIAVIIIVICPVALFSQERFDSFCVAFVKGYDSLNIPGLNLSYADNLAQVGTTSSVQKQAIFFNKIQQGLSKFTVAALKPGQETDYGLIQYETALNLQRLALEKQWIANKPDTIGKGGLYTVPNGKQWYAYFLKKWVAADVTPDEIFAFGLKEVERVKKHIEDIRKETGLSEDAFYKYLDDSSFFLHSQDEVQQAFEHTKTIIQQNIGNLFNKHSFPELAIVRGADAALAQTPGYYNNDTFYYNMFGKPYNKRQVDWLFIHEGVPGHHYQGSIANAINQSPVQQLFFYLGFMEGWAAYTEELGKQLGVYKTPYDELGKWEWDIVRSVRVPLDVGINYYGWSDEEALAFWKKNIKGQDGIAMREINRIKRWPAQVVTYKYGAGQIMQWKEELQKQQGAKFDIKHFHDCVLNHGSLPLFMIKANVFAGKS